MAGLFESGLFESKSNSEPTKTNLEEVGFGDKFRILYVPSSVDRGEEIRFQYLPQVLSESGEWLTINKYCYHEALVESRDKDLVRGEDDKHEQWTEDGALKVIRDFINHHSLFIFKDLEELDVIRAKEMSALEALDLYAQESVSKVTQNYFVSIVLRVHSKNSKEKLDETVPLYSFNFQCIGDETRNGPSPDEIRNEVYSEKVTKFIKNAMIPEKVTELNGLYITGSTNNVVEIKVETKSYRGILIGSITHNYTIDSFLEWYSDLSVEEED
jgi:hypothetical protein